ncbi:hypothetical protein ACOSP7_012599 [Xanthoceras sorbifolium]
MDSGVGTLNVVLARQVLFFTETNPQPRKHTLWQATADFTVSSFEVGIGSKHMSREAPSPSSGRTKHCHLSRFMRCWPNSYLYYLTNGF